MEWIIVFFVTVATVVVLGTFFTVVLHMHEHMPIWLVMIYSFVIVGVLIYLLYTTAEAEKDNGEVFTEEFYTEIIATPTLDY